MVVFTCNHCGESLKKQAVEKHYQWKSCRNGGIFVSCMDCMKDFREQEYVAHTKCISEAEKYSGKDYVPKASQNKGQRKQEAWSDIIQKVLDRGDISPSVRSTLNALTKHENVPRKRPKFVNFMKNISRGTSLADVNRVFDLIEEAYKSEKEEQQATATETQVNENGSKNGVEETTNGEKECLKRKEVEEEETAEKEKPKKKKKKVDEQENGIEDAQPKKEKKKKAKELNGETNGQENGGANDKEEEPGFRWKDTIREIVAEKDNSISLKKLQTKLLKAYKKQVGETDEVNSQTIDVVLKRKLKKMKNISIEEDRVVISSV